MADFVLFVYLCCFVLLFRFAVSFCSAPPCFDIWKSGLVGWGGDDVIPITTDGEVSLRGSPPRFSRGHYRIQAAKPALLDPNNAMYLYMADSGVHQ